MFYYAMKTASIILLESMYKENYADKLTRDKLYLKLIIMYIIHIFVELLYFLYLIFRHL